MNRLQIQIIVLFMFVIEQIGCAQHREPTQSKKSTTTVQLENAFLNLTFNRPVDLQHAGDGSNRIFVVEQAGRILVFPNDRNTPSSKVFLDITSRVKSAGNEEGLLGLAFHANFKSNGYFFVDYTRSTTIPGAASQTTISRFKVKDGNPDEADPNSETIILQITQPYTNHNGGQIVFGPDGYLYIAMGDGGSGGDPQNNSQNKSSHLGKILRINVDQSGGGKNYSIPSDNPFAGNTQGWKEEIWTYGMRNPWRFSYDKETNRWWCGDVGQNKFEEVDILERGKNYGWRIMEGKSCYNPSTGCDTTGLTFPIIDYGRSLGASITGGYIYRGLRVPELIGAYIYTDFVSGRIWALRYDGSTVTENSEILSSGMNISSFGVDQNNELYICAFNGKIWRFVATSSGKINLNTNQLDFGSVQINNSATRQIEISNQGNAPLIISTVSITGTAASDFSTDFSGIKILQISEKIILNVEYRPKNIGSSSAAIVIQSSDLTNPTMNVSLSGNAVSTVVADQTPIAFALSQNYPNPVTNSTEINYVVGRRSYVEMRLLNSLGTIVSKLIADYFDEGKYSVRFDFSQLPVGLYFFKMDAEDFSGLMKMIVAR